MNPSIASIGVTSRFYDSGNIAFPAGLTVGQGMLLFLRSQKSNSSSTLISVDGWTQISFYHNGINGSNGVDVAVFHKIATAEDVALGYVTVNWSTNVENTIGTVISINNCPLSSKISNVNGYVNYGDPITLGGISTMYKNSLLFGFAGSYRAVSGGTPLASIVLATDNVTFTERVNFQGGTYERHCIWSASRNSANPTGNITFNFGTSVYASAIFIALAPISIPTTTTDEATTFLRGFTKAKFSGYIADNGGGSILERGFVYDIASKSAPGNVAPASSGYANNAGDSGTYSTGAFTKAVTDLKSNTTYYVRAYSRTVAGYSYGDEKSFTTETPSLPTANAKEVTSIAQKSASILSSIVSNGGEPTNDGYGIVYGLNSESDPGNVAPALTLYDNFVASISALADVLKTSWTTGMEKTTYTSAGNTTHTITLPTIQEGDIVAVLLAFDANPTITSDLSDWTVESVSPSNTGKLLIMKAKYKMTQLVITLGSSEACDAVAYRLRGNNLTYSYQIGTSSNPTPAVNPAVGSARMAVISALVGFNTGTVTIASYPAGYTDTVLQVSGAGTAYTGIASAYKEANISSETPGSYSFGSAPTSWLAVTIMVWDKEQEYTQLLSNLDAGVEYYLRAYSKNGIGYDYSDEISFITLPYPPKVTSITPVASLTDSNPISVTIIGEHFTPETTVKIDGVAVSDLVIVDNETITCTLPPSATPKVSEIEVENLDGKKSYTSFSYIDLVPPTPQPGTVSASFSVKGIGVLR